MAARMPHGRMPPLARAEPDQETRTKPKGYPCRNPDSNPRCAGHAGRPGGLCRSCGIRQGLASQRRRQGRARPEDLQTPGPLTEAPASPGASPADDQAKAPEPGTYARAPHLSAADAPEAARLLLGLPPDKKPEGSARAPLPSRTPAGRPAGPAAAEGPGPLTLAVCDFFAAATRASERVEARMVLERGKLAISVEMSLP